ncbi:MAG: hypothetical protein ACRDJU_11025 [Actinomycetota bacterium]
MRVTRSAEHRSADGDPGLTEAQQRRDTRRSQTASSEYCGPRALCGWSPPPLPADTTLKSRVDRILGGNLPALVMIAIVVGLLNVAPHLATRPALALEGLGAFVGGAWCSLNFWRCRHAHCLVTGAGWLALSVFVFAEAAIGHSVIGGYEQPVLLGVLAAALLFECGWYSARHTNAVSLRQAHV